MRLFLLTVLLSLTFNASANDFEQNAALWLKSLDGKEYATSWETSDPYFKSQVARAEWEKAAKNAREPLGKLKNRKINKSEFYQTLPGVPDGNYVVISYTSSFEKKQKAVETLTLSKSTNDWKVVGYFIK